MERTRKTGPLADAMAHLVVAEVQLLTAGRQPETQSGLYKAAAHHIRKAGALIEGLRETLPGDNHDRVSRFAVVTEGGAVTP